MSRAIADKTDFVGILRPATTDFLRTVEPLVKQYGVKPNMFMDISKNRGSRHSHVRLWKSVDLGTLRSKDLFLTDEYGELVPLDFFVAKCPPLEKPLEQIVSAKPREIEPPASKEFTITV